MVTAGDWKLGRTIGSGATSTVSIASSNSSGELFAVKSSPLSLAALLKKEQSILCSLSSPHIISCLGADVSTDFYHLFLEFAAGGTLSDIAGTIGEPKIRSFTRQILLALSYLHSNGFAHCDVKGKNVLLGSDGEAVKLGDFGCAREVKDPNFSPCVMGTPAFMAPEVARGEEQGFSGDVWSLGCTVVEMATGGSAWPEAGDALSALYRVGFTPDVPRIPAWMSEEGKDFVSKCFVRDAKRRWTAEQLLRHPFVSAGEFRPIPEKQGRWESPKSNFEFGFWELEEEEEEERERGVETESIVERIRQLSSPAPAEWAWSEGWISVRTSGEEEEEEEEENLIADEEEVSSSGSDSMEEDKDLGFSSFLNDVGAENGTEQTFIYCNCIRKEMDFRVLYSILLIVYFIHVLTKSLANSGLRRTNLFSITGQGLKKIYFYNLVSIKVTKS